MAEGSTCPNCGFRTEKILITCPRCQTQLQHDHCKNCGRCPASLKIINKQK